eukprot:TRINITY_DN56035_c0_g1_i1.p1 TRINITY_DN56035_c0_g1~~TRINITY_DN56035_c0_g1_i1.p1  ORF type:complete len:895 (+),score=123.40 TRINITY_DN56035_c0_g1_i1:165-2849(+)
MAAAFVFVVVAGFGGRIGGGSSLVAEAAVGTFERFEQISREASARRVSSRRDKARTSGAELRTATVAVAAEGGVYLRRDTPVSVPTRSRSLGINASTKHDFRAFTESGEHHVPMEVDLATKDTRAESEASSLIQVTESHEARESGLPVDEDDRPLWSGTTRVAREPSTSSEKVKLNAIVDECMVEGSLPECWQKFGSYGFKRLQADEWHEIELWRHFKEDWMKDPQVQKRKLYELTLPGTHHSAAFMEKSDADRNAKLEYGVVTQNLNVDEQLALGIRAFHFRVAWSPAASRIFASHIELLLPLRPLLQSIDKFLRDYPSEIVIIHISRDTEVVQNAGTSDMLRMFEEEDRDRMRIPGQSVHQEVLGVFSKLLALYDRLRDLPKGMSMENPTVAALVELNARVIYFWEGQQVLCHDVNSCKRTPGWAPNPNGWSLPFGPPLKFGERTQVLSDARAIDQDVKALEPSCLFHTEYLSKSDKPDKAVRQLKAFAVNMQEALNHRRPTCFPADAPPPEPKEPTVMYIADAFILPTKSQIESQQEIIGNAYLVYSRGEGFSVRSEAERYNFLLLNWFFRPSLRDVYTAPNIISMDFPPVVIVQRIIDAMQEKRECGWAIYCRETDSCNARNLLDTTTKKPYCVDEAEMEALLMQSLTKPTLLSFRLSTGIALSNLLMLLWLMVVAIYWRCFLFLIRPDLVLQPVRTNSMIGVIVFGCWGREKFKHEDMPLRIVVTGTEGYDGKYKAVRNWEPNGMPLWKLEGGESYIFSGTTGIWLIGDEAEKSLNFKCLYGNYGSKEQHQGKMPHEIEEGGWEEFNAATKVWSPCPGLTFESADDGYSDDEANSQISEAKPSAAQGSGSAARASGSASQESPAADAEGGLGDAGGFPAPEGDADEGAN